MRFVPMHFSFSHSTIGGLYRSFAFALAPSAHTISSLQPAQLANIVAGGYGLPIRNRPDDNEPCHVILSVTYYKSLPPASPVLRASRLLSGYSWRLFGERVGNGVATDSIVTLPSPGRRAIPLPGSALRGSGLPGSLPPARGPAQEHTERRDYQHGDHERQDRPEQETVPGPHQQERGHAGDRHDERDGPDQDEQQGLGVYAIHATSSPGLWPSAGRSPALRRRRPARRAPRRSPSGARCLSA